MSRRSPILHRWQDYRRTINWQSMGAVDWGRHYGTHEPVCTSTLQAQVVRIPAGQATPVLSANGDHFTVQLVGEVCLIIGEQRWTVKPYDIVTIPAGTPHFYRNSGIEDVLFYLGYERPEQGGYELVALEDSDARLRATPGAEVTHLRWEEYRRRIVYRGALSERNGYHRGVYPFVETAGMRGHAVRVPAGQGSPWHTGGADLLFLGLRGELEFYADPDAPKAYPVGPCDILMVPDAFYGDQNVGFEDAIYLSMSAKSETREKPVYHEPAVVGDPLAGPGEPV